MLPIVKRARPFAAILVVVVLLVLFKLGMNDGGHAGAGGMGGRGGGPGGPAAVQVEVVHSERLAERITAVGTVRPNEMVEIRTEVAGRVSDIRFREGARVARGEVLLRIDDSELRAQLARAESRLAIAEKEEKRQRDLHEQKVTSAREFDTAVNNLAVAKAEADLIRAQLAKTEIRAPFAGVVGLRSVSEGTYLSAATPITTLVDDRTVKIDFAIPERHASRIKPGDDIHFTIEGTPAAFTGQVYALESAIDERTRTLGVRATSSNERGAIVPGAFAQVEVLLPERDALMVPAFALVPEMRGHRAFVMHGGKAEVRQVKIGERTNDRVEVLDGLAAGDTLITSAILQLRPGAPVTLQPAK